MEARQSNPHSARRSLCIGAACVASNPDVLSNGIVPVLERGRWRKTSIDRTIVEAVMRKAGAAECFRQILHAGYVLAQRLGLVQRGVARELSSGDRRHRDLGRSRRWAEKAHGEKLNEERRDNRFDVRLLGAGLLYRDYECGWEDAPPTVPRSSVFVGGKGKWRHLLASMAGGDPGAYSTLIRVTPITDGT